ncbi:oleosin G-like [Andrographis paniculata]|uniref:oleosin G-like n=1 Tax=Andrographis paniculata TaxID=175694 RepID=UPI0021E8C50C|nr:oleosin G-like [Andrographis paniculata]
MADWQYPPRKPSAAPFAAAAFFFIQKLRDHAPHSPRLTGFATLVISSAILLFLSGLTLTATFLALIFFIPLILISSPIWIPLSILIFISATFLATLFGFSVATATTLSWIFKYLKNGSKRLNSTARYSADYAREPHGEYFQSKAKDAAPGA